MDKTMTASMTDGQIENVTDKLRAAMRKHRSDISPEVAQQVLGVENLGMELFAVVRKYAEWFSKLVVRHVKVKRTQTPKQMLDATGCKQYVTDNVVKAMPRGNGEKATVFFFKPDPEAYKDGYISDDNLEKEYEKHDLKPDPYAQSKANEDDPTLVDSHPNACHWKDEDGNWCYTAFRRWFGERSVYVDRSDYDWRDYWFFAGVRK